MRHRKDVGRSEPQKSPGQSHFRRSSGSGRAPRASNELHDRQSVLHEGLHDDLPRYLNQDLLLQMWPVLRTLVGRTVRTV
ncbi:hypothetical protein DBP22_23305 [Streptomyces sp. CS207]|nr:hypothetical protein DBP22_23305 [Streptomyces sp. CS207]